MLRLIERPLIWAFSQAFCEKPTLTTEAHHKPGHEPKFLGFIKPRALTTKLPRILQAISK